MSQSSPTKRSIECKEEHVINKKVKLETTNDTKEPDVGITHYLSKDIPGFRGQIKQRYTDFLVNEITKSNEVIHLTDNGFKMPKKVKQTPNELKAQQDEDAKLRQEFKMDTEIRKQLVEILGEEDVVRIETVYRDVTKMETSKSFDEKSIRTKIHQLLRIAFNNQLESVTSDSNTFHIARATRNSRVDKQTLINQTKDENGVENWGYGRSKEFIHFTVYKENKDTMDVANTLANFLKIPPRLIRFAGTKDRRAVTCQKMSLSKVGLDRLNSLNKALKGIVIGGYKYEESSLSLGDLNGNEFVIAIRNASIKDNSNMKLEEILEKGCTSLKENGFINYFGMQRFGTFSISTHEIGKELLQGNWKKAVDLILAEQENVLPTSKEARKIWAETHDPNAAIAKMPRQCIAEKSILNSLCGQNKDESGLFSENAYYMAINKIPRNLRTMYVHAYQSYIWNVVASRRIEMFGLNIIAGDLIIDNDSQSINSSKVENLCEEFEDLKDSQFIHARPVTQAEINSNQYSINDVVLPTPGFDIIYPTNDHILQSYVEVMAKDCIDPFDMKRKVRDFSLAGSYRYVINKPKDLEYHIVSYSDSNQQLINTDLEILNNQKAKDNGRSFMKNKLTLFPHDNSGEYIAILLKFKLGVSAYATMLLRELMKLETSRRGDMCDVKV